MYNNTSGLAVTSGGAMGAAGLAYTGASAMALGLAGATLVLMGLVLLRLVSVHRARAER